MGIKLEPVLPELQARAAALDARCDISLTRMTEYQCVGAGGQMIWCRIAPHAGGSLRARRACYVRVTLRHEGGGTGHTNEMIHAIDTTCAAALEEAVTEAERRGWHQPR